MTKHCAFCNENWCARGLCPICLSPEIIASSLENLLEVAEFAYMRLDQRREIKRAREVVGLYRDAIAAATGTAKTAKQAECEASQSGPKASPETPHGIR